MMADNDAHIAARWRACYKAATKDFVEAQAKEIARLALADRYPQCIRVLLLQDLGDASRGLIVSELAKRREAAR